ncbi:MAG TPA: hypothetical protein VLT59_15360, partial [Steroidobacteraceae bacterium]|nr:hypothetical protein [Steroidobacteraceae bacterium]
HGALAHDGRARLRWWRADASGNLEIEWREQTTMTLQPSRRRGFGWTLLERLVPRAVDGQHLLELGEHEFVYRLTVSASGLRHDTQDR